MRQREQSQEQQSSQNEVKKPGAWSKLLDKFGLGNRWKQEVTYLESLESTEITPEQNAQAEAVVSRIESQVQTEIATGIEALTAELDDATQELDALGNQNPSLRAELEAVQAEITTAASIDAPSSVETSVAKPTIDQKAIVTEPVKPESKQSIETSHNQAAYNESQEAQRDFQFQTYTNIKKVFEQKNSEYTVDNPYHRSAEDQQKFAAFAAYETIKDDALKETVDRLRKQWAISDGLENDYDIASEQFKLQTGEALLQTIKEAEHFTEVQNFQELYTQIDSFPDMMTNSSGILIKKREIKILIREYEKLSQRPDFDTSITPAGVDRITRKYGLRETVLRLMRDADPKQSSNEQKDAHAYFEHFKFTSDIDELVTEVGQRIYDGEYTNTFPDLTPQQFRENLGAYLIGATPLDSIPDIANLRDVVKAFAAKETEIAERKVTSVKNFDELLENVNYHDLILTTNGELYSACQVKERITAVRDGKQGISYVPRVRGYRDTVRRLMKESGLTIVPDKTYEIPNIADTKKEAASQLKDALVSLEYTKLSGTRAYTDLEASIQSIPNLVERVFPKNTLLPNDVSELTASLETSLQLCRIADRELADTTRSVTNRIDTNPDISSDDLHAMTYDINRYHEDINKHIYMSLRANLNRINDILSRMNSIAKMIKDDEQTPTDTSFTQAITTLQQLEQSALNLGIEYHQHQQAFDATTIPIIDTLVTFAETPKDA